MKRKQIISTIGIAIAASVLLIVMLTRISQPHITTQTESVAVRSIASQIQADGEVTSQNEAKLSFETSGKLVSLPYKEGDIVRQGQTIASLDTYALQRQLTAALNTYRSTRDSFDQTQENVKTGALQGSNVVPVNPFNPLGVNGVSVTTGGDTEYTMMHDIAKRVLDQNQSNLDNSVIQVELANYALQLATLTSPITGVITHEDVTVPNINITPASTFIVDDMNALVFRANVTEEDIDYVSEGSRAVVSLNGSKKILHGTVIKIYPQKIVLANGQSVYRIDIQTDTDLKTMAQFGQGGTVAIQSNADSATRLVPSWAVLNNQYLWIEKDGKKILQQIVAGKTHDGSTEIIEGLRADDRIIINPESVISNKYIFL